MEKINANGNVSYFLLFLVLVSLSGMAGAVDIIFYSSSSGCSGSGYSFNGIARQVCCIADGGSVLLTDMDSCKTGPVYRTAGCSGSPAGSSTGNFCWYGGGYKAAYWYQSCRRRSMLSHMITETNAERTECNSIAKPNGIVWTEEVNKGTWMLKSTYPEEMFSRLESLPDCEKVGWLEANGAVFKVHTLSTDRHGLSQALPLKHH